MVDKKMYIGKRIDWSNLVLFFPNLWVALKDCTFTGIDVESAILVDVLDDDEIIEYINKHFNEYEVVERTTDYFTGGYVHAEIREDII